MGEDTKPYIVIHSRRRQADGITSEELRRQFKLMFAYQFPEIIDAWGIKMAIGRGVNVKLRNPMAEPRRLRNMSLILQELATRGCLDVEWVWDITEAMEAEGIDLL